MYQGLNNKMNCQLILINKVCAAVLLLWVMEAMFNRILFCCNGHQGTVLRFVEIVAKPPRVQCRKTISEADLEGGAP